MAKEHVRVWSSNRPLAGALVFLGDSHIELGRWNEWWPKQPVLNRGIGGDRIAGVLARLDEVVRHEPRLIVLQCGINDLVDRTPPETVCQQYGKVLIHLNQHIPRCHVWVQSVLPVHPIRWRELPLVQAHAYVLDLNAKVRELNLQLEEWTHQHEAFFLNLHPLFEKEGALRPECTLDGMHLNEFGYRLWRETLQQQPPSELSALFNS